MIFLVSGLLLVCAGALAVMRMLFRLSGVGGVSVDGRCSAVSTEVPQQ